MPNHGERGEISIACNDEVELGQKSAPHRPASFSAGKHRRMDHDCPETWRELCDSCGSRVRKQ